MAVRRRALSDATKSMGQSPIDCSGSESLDWLDRITRVTRHERTVEIVTEVTRARMTAVESLDKVGDGLVDCEA